MSTSPIEDKLREEVDFWRGLIEHWKRVNRSPPLARMLEALAYAEHKLQKYLAAQGQCGREHNTGSSDQHFH